MYAFFGWGGRLTVRADHTEVARLTGLMRKSLLWQYTALSCTSNKTLRASHISNISVSAAPTTAQHQHVYPQQSPGTSLVTLLILTPTKYRKMWNISVRKGSSCNHLQRESNNLLLLLVLCFVFWTDNSFCSSAVSASALLALYPISSLSRQHGDDWEHHVLAQTRLRFSNKPTNMGLSLPSLSCRFGKNNISVVIYVSLNVLINLRVKVRKCEKMWTWQWQIAMLNQIKKHIYTIYKLYTHLLLNMIEPFLLPLENKGKSQSCQYP